MNKFYKVSYEQFKKDYLDCFKDNIPEGYDKSILETEIKEIYDNIKLPKRATKDSAGYDFFSPFSMQLSSGTSIKIPTGIKVQINEGWFLGLFPRSGLGFKYRMQLDNSVGIIDALYIQSDNEGHIMAKITNDSKYPKDMYIKEGQGFMQGIFLPFGITEDDDADGIRNGGFGSTDK